MRAVAIMVALFALLAFDLTQNRGEWVGSVTDIVGHVSHEMRVTLNR
jgi:hypothetical protein